ncbi:MAG: CocE/NonD family hydrolase [Egibacteraceae bacterium]
MTALRRPVDPTDLPLTVAEVEHFTIPMADGIQLAARRWQPVDVEDAPVPAVLEYIPYRKRDRTRHRDQVSHAYVAAHGYVAVRVDIRGSGDSEGVLTDEYLAGELDDGLAVLSWIAEQPWCDGRIGIIGKSWGGFNGLQLAALRPPELGAVITVCSTDDRYADDVHYMGGCLLGDNLSWSSAMFANTSCPPDPALVGERWREMWMERLEGSGLWLETWLSHQHRDEYWQHGSVCEDYSAIQVPVMAVSGWADGYSNSVFRLIEHLDVPRRGLVGPWSHKYPHLGVPGPAIGFLQECVRWWDRWLKGIDNGVEDEPALTAWMQDSIAPALDIRNRPGRWITEQTWPSPRVTERVLTFANPGARGLLFGEHPAGDAIPHSISSPLSVGLYAGKWCSFTATPDLPTDQRDEDGGSLNYDTAALTESLEILGAPIVELELSSDRPVAMVAVRLSDRLADGRTTRVTYGLLNLCQRDSREHPAPLEPGTPYRVQVQLNEVAHRFPVGNRLRLEISTSYWPVAWPPPHPVSLTLNPANSRVLLPVRPSVDEDPPEEPFGPPEAAPPPPETVLAPRGYEWTVRRDMITQESTLETVKDEGVVRLEDIDLELHSSTTERYTYREGDHSSVRGMVDSVRRFVRGDWDVRTRTWTILTCTPEEFVITAHLEAYEGQNRAFVKTWDIRIPRDLL